MKAPEADSSAGMPLEEKVRDAHLEGRWISMKKSSMASQKISFLYQWMSERLVALVDHSFNMMDVRNLYPRGSTNFMVWHAANVTV